MKTVLYFQKQKEDAKGRKIKMGEDAYPYADDDILIAADGLGGRGGYAHTKFDPRLLDRDAFFGLAFSPIFTAEVSQDYKDFVLQSFQELFENKDDYFENPAVMKHSGYFASRFVTAIALYELKYNPHFEKTAMLAAIRAASDEAREALMAAYADQLAVLIHEKLSQIAQNLGFEVETKITGAYLLPSTLTVAITDEHEDSVDVLYFWAGDSRGYIWDAEGLGQTTEDHEKDETMTNLITLSKPFRVESRMITVKKPCLIFNATDGCYKCPIFESPFDMEFVYLSAFCASDSFEGACQYLAEQFAQIGRHDDSNTMALHAFGYADYAAVKAAAEQRMQDIENTIIARLPGILQINYPYELQQLTRKMGECVYEARAKLFEVPEIAALVCEDMTRHARTPSADQKLAEREREQAELRATQALAEVRAFLEARWLLGACLKKQSAAAERFEGESPYDTLTRLYEEQTHLDEAYAAAVLRARTALDTGCQNILNYLTYAPDLRSAMRVTQTRSFYNYFLQAKNYIVEATGFVKSIKEGENEQQRKFQAIEAELQALNARYCTLDAEEITAMAQALVEKGEVPPSFALDAEEQQELLSLFECYVQNTNEAKNITEQLSNAQAQQLATHWEKSARRLCRVIWEEKRELIPVALLAEISTQMAKMQEEYDKLQAEFTLRAQIYEEYAAVYKRQYRESRI